jgi:hypothetical protein
LLASAGQTSGAVIAFQQAIAAADNGSGEAASGTSVGQAMLALAALYRQQGAHQQAESLEAQAAALEGATEDAGAPTA